jgi:hypothetical protein
MANEDGDGSRVKGDGRATKAQPPVTEGNGPQSAEPEQVFRRERAYPDVAKLFAFRHPSWDEVKSASIVALDTSALLVPYSAQSKSLQAVSKAYKTLATGGRLRIPARAAREYLDNQPTKIADVLNAVVQMKQGLTASAPLKYPLLSGVAEFEGLNQQWAKMSEEIEEYRKRLGKLQSLVSSWQGNDPVSSVYAVFTEGMVIEPPPLKEEDVLEAWQRCLRLKIPPGYKDGRKEDTGVGDYLIWQSILRIGEIEKRPLVFVSGEKKADWCVKSNGQPLSPRPELSAEYHRASGGQGFYIISLSELVEWFGAGEEEVKDLRKVEREQQKDHASATSQSGRRHSIHYYLMTLKNITTTEQAIEDEVLIKVGGGQWYRVKGQDGTTRLFSRDLINRKLKVSGKEPLPPITVS